MSYENIATRIATDTIIDGVFMFSDTLDNQPARMEIRTRDRDSFYGSCPLWVENSSIKIIGEGRYLSGWKVDSKVNEQIALNRFQDVTRKESIVIDSLSMIRNALGRHSDRTKNIRSEIDSLYSVVYSKELELIKKDCNSLSAMERFYGLAKFNKKIPLDTIADIYNNLSETFKKSIYGEGIYFLLNKPTPPQIGESIIEVELFDLNGKLHSLRDYHEKYVLLDFWSMACYPCILAAPELRELNEKYSDRITIIGVNLDTKLELWREATKRDSITWINLSDGKGTFAGAGVAYGINGLPTYILIDPQGTILDRWTGFKEGLFEEKLKPFLVE